MYVIAVCICLKNANVFFFSLVKPRIDRSKLEGLIFKAGQMILLDVDVIGEPPPTVVWSFKGKVSIVIVSDTSFGGFTRRFKINPLFDVSRISSLMMMYVLTTLTTIPK